MISSAVAKLLNNTIILENSGIIYLQTLGIFFLDWYIVINSYIAIYDKIFCSNYAKPLVQDFISIGNGVTTNVYTFYQYYINDFGYIYAILIANNVDKFKLVAVINNLNCIYAEEWQEDGVVQDSLIHEVNTDFYRALNKKYLEIVKEKLK